MEETFFKPYHRFFNLSVSTTLYSGVFYCTFADYIIVRVIALHGKVFQQLINQKLVFGSKLNQPVVRNK